MMKPSRPGSSLVMRVGFMVTTLRQSNNPPSEKDPCHQVQKKVRLVKSNVKSMIVTFFDIKGIVHKEFVPTGQNVNSGFYCDILWGNCVNMREDVAPNFGENRPGCFTMTMPSLALPSSPSSSWQKTKCLSSLTRHTPLIWYPVTSSYFQK
jgi:hypothetical protein